MFKIGDLVRGKGNSYIFKVDPLTIKKGKVLFVQDKKQANNNDMEIQVLETTDGSKVNTNWMYSFDDFELINESKMDCSITENYQIELKRMTKNCLIGCNHCPMCDLNNKKQECCASYQMNYPQEAIKIVQKWSDEHPVKTYKDVFLEKFPNAPLRNNGYPGYPQMSAIDVFGNGKQFGCSFMKNWDMPYVED